MEELIEAWEEYEGWVFLNYYSPNKDERLQQLTFKKFLDWYREVYPPKENK